MPEVQPDAAENRFSFTKFEIRQHMLEDGTFIDFPAAVLCDPPPKPAEFLYLQHHFQTPSGVKQDLKASGSAEAQLDILANELESMRRLLHGYVHNLHRYVKKFEGDHKMIEDELSSLDASYKGLYVITAPACKASVRLECMFEDLESKVSLLNYVTRPPPVIIKKHGRRGLQNPSMDVDEQTINNIRHDARSDNLYGESWVTSGQLELEETSILAELVNPPLPTQPEADVATPANNDARAAHTHQANSGADNATEHEPHGADAVPAPLDARVSLKIEKLAGGLEAMRDALQRTHELTEEELKYLRAVNAMESQDIEDTWKMHDYIEGLAFNTGKVSELNIRRVEAYDRWATGCLEDMGLKAPPAEQTMIKPAAPTQSPSGEASASMTSPDGAIIAANAAASTSTPDANALVPEKKAQTAPSVKDDVYAVCLDLKCEKSFDELTHQEAIDVLKALPLHIQFMPCAAPENSVEHAPTESDEAEVEAILSAVRRQEPGKGRLSVPMSASAMRRAQPSEDPLVGSAPSESIVDVEQPPAAPQKVPSRKRARSSEEENRTLQNKRTRGSEEPGDGTHQPTAPPQATKRTRKHPTRWEGTV